MDFENLPDGWELTSLGQLGNWSSGGTPSRRKPQYYGGSIPWVKTGNLPDGLILEIDEYITEEGLKNSSAKLLPENTLLMAMYGATIGKLGILGFPAASNQACAALISQGITKELIPYVFYFLKSAREDLKKIGKGGAQPNISQTIIKDVSIPLPPLNEQKRIVKKVEALGCHVRRSQEALEEIPQLIEQFRQSVLAAAFRGDLTADWRKQNPNVEPASVLLEPIKENKLKMAKSTREKNQIISDSELPITVNSENLPERWIQCCIGHIGYVCNGSTPSRKNEDYWNGNIPWVSSGEVQNNIISKTREKITRLGYENSSVKLLSKGSVLIAMIGEGKTRGQTSILDIEATTNQNIAAIRLDHNRISNELLWYWFQYQYSKTRTFGSGSGPQALNCQKVREMPFVLPPFDEQKIVVSQIKKFLSLIKKVEAELKDSTENLDFLNQSILAKAFRGELVPQDPNDEPAAVLLERIRAEQEKRKPQKKRKSDRRKKKTVS